MTEDQIKARFNNSSDLIITHIKGISVLFLESTSSSDKVNDYILKSLTLKKNFASSIKNLLAAPNIKEVADDIEQYVFYLTNGFSLIIYHNKVYAIETRADLHRSVSIPQTQQAIYGPKDSFTENIQMNLGLVKRRIKSSHLQNEDINIGRKTQTKVSVLYMDDICDMNLVNDVMERLKAIDVDGIFDSGNLVQFITDETKTPFPTVAESERPDVVASDLLEGKIAILVDTSPFAIIIPAFFFDFINPRVDKYNKSINVNFLKIIRFLCLIITVLAPGIYIAITNYNQETIPLSLLVNFSMQRDGVPFPAAIECFIMLLLCEILRESDIRFPSSYGSSISILGALILGDAAVNAGIVSPIMIIIVAITFITSLIFTEMEMINSLRNYRFLFLLAAVFGGLFGIVLACLVSLVHLCSVNTFGMPYTYPLAPYDKTYAKKTLLKGKTKEDKYRSKMLSKKNRVKLGD